MIFKDRVRKEPYKRKITYENGHVENVKIEEADENIIENGTPLNATNMNKLFQKTGGNIDGILQIKNKGVNPNIQSHTCNSLQNLKDIGNSYIPYPYLLRIDPETNFSGAPFGSSTFLLLGEQTSVNWGCQLAVSDAYEGIKYRRLTAGTWNEWKSIQAI